MRTFNLLFSFSFCWIFSLQWHWSSTCISFFSVKFLLIFTNVALIFLLYEEFESKFPVESLPVHNTTHQTPFAPSQLTSHSLYHSVTVCPPSIQISIYYRLYSQCQLLWLLQYQNVHQLLLHLELSPACLLFLSCLPLLTKPPFVCQITVWMCLYVTSTVAKQATAHRTVQVTFLQTNCTTVVIVDSFPHSCYLYFSISY